MKMYKDFPFNNKEKFYEEVKNIASTVDETVAIVHAFQFQRALLKFLKKLHPEFTYMELIKECLTEIRFHYYEDKAIQERVYHLWCGIPEPEEDIKC